MRNTKKLLAVLLSALMVMSCFVGMTFTVAAEEPVDTTPTYMIDWTNMPASSQVASSNDTTIVSWDKGYLDTNFTGNTNDPFISFGVDNVTGKDMAYMVIKYKTTTINDAAQLMWGTTDGTQGFGSNNGAFRWNKKDEWDTMLVYDGLETGNGTWDGSNETVTASVPWANDERTLNGIRFYYYTYDYIGSMASSDGHGLDLAYIAFFATKESAEAFMAEQAALEAMMPTFTFPAVNGATSYWTTKDSKEYRTSDTVFPLTATNVPTTLTSTAGGLGSVSAEGFGYTSDGANTWLASALAASYLDKQPDRRVTVEASWDAITFTGWFREVPFADIKSVGLRIGSTDILIDANTSSENVHEVDLMTDAANPVWYQKGLVTTIDGSDARRFYIEIPTASIPDGDSEANVIIKATDGTIYTMNSWGTFLVAKNVTVVDYDYVDEEGNEYDVADPSANGQELYVDGKNTGLITVNNNTGIWARSQYHVELDSSTLSSAASDTTNDVGAPYYFEVKDAEGNPMAGATILLKNAFGIVTRAETNANGMAVGYTSSQWAVTYEVVGTEYTGTPVAGVLNLNKIGGPVEDEPVVPAIGSAAVELGETISVHYYATVEGALEVTMAGKTTVLDAPVYNESTKLYDYVFTGILPQQMAENIAAVLKVDGEVVDEQAEFDLVAYMTAIYNNGEASDELKALAAAALEYGVAAQEYLDYEGAAIEVIADSGYEVAAASAEGYAKTENAQYIKAAGVRYDYGCNGLYFKLNKADGMVVTLNGKAVTPVAFDENTDIVRVDLSALELTDLYTLEVTVGTTVETIVYSVEIYAARMSANADANAALAAALFTYGVAAQAYVG